MVKISELLTGVKVLEETESPINGKITVIKSLAFGKYIQVGGLTQSGGIIKDIWKKTLAKVSKVSNVPKVPQVLILGLGGGSIVDVVQKYWPKTKITAVDIDAKMVELGKKYLGLDENDIKIVIEDAEKYLLQKSKIKNLQSKNDLGLVALYVGDEFPKKFESKNYIHLVRSHLESSGIAVFNRLYYGEKRSQSVKFGKLLEKIFSKVDVFYPEANIMFICYS